MFKIIFRRSISFLPTINYYVVYPPPKRLLLLKLVCVNFDYYNIFSPYYRKSRCSLSCIRLFSLELTNLILIDFSQFRIFVDFSVIVCVYRNFLFPFHVPSFFSQPAIF